MYERVSKRAGIIQYGRQLNKLGPVIPQATWITIALPLLAFLVFGWLFILANPDWVVSFGEGMQRVFDVLQHWVHSYSPDLTEAGFWFAALWVLLGLLRPATDRSYLAESADNATDDDDSVTTDAFLYPALRNTLVTVMILFAVYLVFGHEWSTNEVAGFLGVSKATVQTHVERGMRKLRRRLGVEV